jgi:DNA (cytosine-5)-methyltransferase 1
MTGMVVGSLFSGYGGLDRAVTAVTGGRVGWHCEIDTAAVTVLAHHHPDVPNLGDISTVDWNMVEPVDILAGGFPCTDISTAGLQAGLRPGTRSGLWSHMAHAVSVLRPRLVVIENVRGLLSVNAHGQVEPCPWCVGNRAEQCVRALGAVLADLADIGYDAAWCGLRASDVGAPHPRFRVFIAATDTRGGGRRTAQHDVLPGQSDPGRSAVADTDRAGSQRSEPTSGSDLSARSVAADAHHVGPVRTGPTRRRGTRPAHGSADIPADTHRPVGRQSRHVHTGTPPGPEPETLRRVGRSGDTPVATEWGDYEPAIRRWESMLQRPAPAPTVAGQRSGRQLNPRFVEWMMGLPDGHVTAVPGLSRNDMLRLLGNGVVPQQAAAALDWLLPRLTAAHDPQQEVTAA